MTPTRFETYGAKVRTFSLEPAEGPARGPLVTFNKQLMCNYILEVSGAGRVSLTMEPPVQAAPWTVSIEGRPVTKELAEAREDLLRVFQEAEEEGYPRPTELAFNAAARLLTTMYAISPRRFEVYPTPDAEIAIDTAPRPGKSLIVLCDSDGEVLYLLYIDGCQESERLRSVDDLSLKALHRLLSAASA